MRRLVIPDIHENIIPVCNLLLREKHDEAIFLGDWVDRFPSQPGNLYLTLDFLLSALKEPNKVFIYGNHDMPYAFPKAPVLGCSGYQWKHAEEIGMILGGKLARERFKLYYEADGYLLSHAGLSSFNAYPDWREKAGEAIPRLENGEMSYWVAAGVARGGSVPKGGLTWLDWDREFQPVEGLKQIVGHSKGYQPRRKGPNYCIDTALDHYGILEDGLFTVYNFDGTEYQWND